MKLETFERQKKLLEKSRPDIDGLFQIAGDNLQQFTQHMSNLKKGYEYAINHTQQLIDKSTNPEQKSKLYYELLGKKIMMQEVDNIIQIAEQHGKEIFNSPNPPQKAKELLLPFRNEITLEINELNKMFHDLIVNIQNNAQSIAAAKIDSNQKPLSGAVMHNLRYQYEEFKDVCDTIDKFYKQTYQKHIDIAQKCKEMIELHDKNLSQNQNMNDSIDTQFLRDQFVELSERNKDLQKQLVPLLSSNNQDNYYKKNSLLNELRLQNKALKLLQTTTDIVNSNQSSKDYYQQKDGESVAAEPPRNSPINR